MKRFTIGQVVRLASERLGELVPLHRVTYAIRSGRIEPCERIGRYRLFDEAAVNQIINALA